MVLMECKSSILIGGYKQKVVRVQYRPQKSLDMRIERFFASFRFEQRERLDQLEIEIGSINWNSANFGSSPRIIPEKAIRGIMRRTYFSINAKTKCVMYLIAATGSQSPDSGSHFNAANNSLSWRPFIHCVIALAVLSDKTRPDINVRPKGT